MTAISTQGYADKIMWWTRTFLRFVRRSIVGAPGMLWKELRVSRTGFLMVFGAWRDWALVKSQTEEIKYNRALASKQGLLLDQKFTRDRDKAASFRQRASLLLFLIVALALTVTYFVFRNHPDFWGYVSLSAVGLFLLFDGIGHTHKDPETEYAPRPVTPLEPGVSIQKLQASIQEVLAESRPPVFISFHGQRWMDHGVELDCHTSDKITDEHLRELERNLQAGQGMITLIRDRKNSAAPVLRLFWRDPLAGAVTPSRRAPKSLSCKNPFSLTRIDDGGRGSFNVLGVHQFWTGQSGSGKSSGFWVLLDWMVDCTDADVFGIDLTTGPVFGAYRRVMTQVAYDADDAEEILDAAIAECERRNAELNAGMDADDDGLDDENYVISDAPGKRAWFIIIDEYTTLAAKSPELRQKVERVMEIGRKARIHVIIGSPAADKKALGSTTPVNQSMTKVTFSTPFSMIAHVLGVGMSDDGWRPDRFEVGTPTDPADSGKAYIQSPENTRPVVQRFDRLTAPEIRERNRDRREYLRATVKLPEALELMRTAFGDAGNPDRMRTSDILEHDLAAGWTDRKLATELKKEKVEPKALNGVGEKTARGYEWEPIRQAVLRYNP